MDSLNGAEGSAKLSADILLPVLLQIIIKQCTHTLYTLGVFISDLKGDHKIYL